MTIEYKNYKRAVSSEAALLLCKMSLPLASHVVRAFLYLERMTRPLLLLNRKE
jgi:hypothetical protein|nr:MAG TPA: hypothetical protein [Caudoviricetes sp.]